MNPPQFTFALLHPKFWLTWFGISLLYLISWLPYRLQLGLGRFVGILLYKFFKSRVKIARTNLKLCFPDMSEQDREAMVIENFKATGIALFESGMGWWWPTWRIQKLGNVKGVEHIQKAKEAGHGVLVVAHHMVCLEICNRLVGLKNPNIGFYRPHNNAVMEWLQYRGRTRNNRHQIGKRDLKGLFKALADNESIIYLPDQDYGRRRSVFVPFFAVKQTCTTTGTSMIAKESKCKLVITTSYRNHDNSGYTVEFSPAIDNYPSGDDEQDALRLNQLIEKEILKTPEQYMWLHRRFKTRPNKSDKNLY